MKKVITMTALAVLAMSASAVAEERIVNDSRLQQSTPVHDMQSRNAVTSERTVELRQALQERMQAQTRDDLALPKVAYRELSMGTPAVRGEQEVSAGTVTVLADNVSVNDIAREFGLSVVYQDQSTGLGVLDIAGHDDIMALVQQLRASDMVRAARPSRTEREFELDIAR